MNLWIGWIPTQKLTRRITTRNSRKLSKSPTPSCETCTLPVAVEAMLTMVDTRMTNCKEVPIASSPNIDDGVFVCVSVCRWLIYNWNNHTHQAYHHSVLLPNQVTKNQKIAKVY